MRSPADGNLHAKEYRPAVLHELLTSNRSELISRCKAKVAKRFAPAEIPAGVDNGVPLFLGQLVETLHLEQQSTVRDAYEPSRTPASTEIGRAAALHGADMLRRGYNLDQVVHDYGDVCQSVTELAVERNALITADEFRTLNRCLDNAIADAVTAFARGGKDSINEQAEALSEHLGWFSYHHVRLLDMAIQSFNAIQTGNIGATGATGIAHKNSLLELRALVQQSMAEIRLASAKTTLPPYPKPATVKESEL